MSTLVDSLVERTRVPVEFGPSARQRRGSEPRLRDLVRDFSENPGVTRLAMRRLLASDPSNFALAAAGIAGEPIDSGAAEALGGLLATQAGVVEFLCDPRMMDLTSALALARLMAASSKTLDVQLVQRLQDNAGRDDVIAYRALELISHVSDGQRIVVQLVQLSDAPDRRIRSKVALLAGRVRRDPKWLARFLRDPDSRVRANAVEAMWGAHDAASVEQFELAAADRHHRVAANAVVGLHMAGEPVVPRLDRMLRDPDPLFRAAGAWASGECGSVSMVANLQSLAAEPGPARRAALRALVRLRGPSRTVPAAVKRAPGTSI